VKKPTTPHIQTESRSEENENSTLPSHLIYQKRHKAKRVSKYSKSDMDAILGISKTPLTDENSDVTSPNSNSNGDSIDNTSSTTTEQIEVDDSMPSFSLSKKTKEIIEEDRVV